MPPKRMTTNPTKPARHRAGKPTGAASESDSDSASGSSEAKSRSNSKSKSAGTEGRKTIARPPPPKFASAGRIISKGASGKIDLQGVLGQGQEKEKEEKRRRRERAEAAARAAGFVTDEEDEDEDGDGDQEGSDNDEEGEDEDEEEESSEGESESEEEPPRRLMLPPRLIRKGKRQGAGAGAEEEDEAAAAEEEARRRKAADELVEEQIRKDLAARTARRKHWEDGDVDGGGGSGEEGGSDAVDTTDEVDPEAEYAAWKLRELRRIRRERAAIEAREAEIAELERRRGLTAEERRAEDEAHVSQQRAEKEGRGRTTYLQRYFHRGAFYAGEAAAEGLDRRDVMAGARFEDEVQNRELLPKALQMRDMTKLGRKGATKYKDLRSEDTGRWGMLDSGDRQLRGRGGDRSLDERFQSDDRVARDWGRGGGGREGDGAKGANAIPLGERKGDRDTADGTRWNRDRPDDRDRSRKDSGREGGCEAVSASDRNRDRNRDRDRDRDREHYRSRNDDDRDGRRRSRSRSRSPRRERDRDRDDDGYRGHRKRERSRDRQRYDDDGDKRRRIDAK